MTIFSRLPTPELKVRIYMTNIRRSILKRLVKAQTPLLTETYLSQAILRTLRYERAEAGTFGAHAAGTLPPVFPASYNEVAKPKALYEDKLMLRAPLPVVQPIILKNTRLDPYSGAMHKKNVALVWQKELDQKHRFKREFGRSSLIKANNVVYFKSPAESYLTRGLCAVAPGATNWYHWLIEILPTIMLLQNLPKDYDHYPLLVPQEVLSGGTFREALDLFAGRRSVIGLDRDKNYRVGEMVIIPPPVSGPFNMHDHLWPEPEDYINNIGVMQQFRTQTLERLAVTDNEHSPKRLFFARAPGTRSYNQNDIVEVARARGFVIMRPEKLSFREQVQMMYNADFVAGPSGAAWANSIFMRPGTKSLIWSLKEYDGACFFSNLGHVAGCQTTYCFVDADVTIRNSYEAFSASYVLTPKEFSDHLDALL